MQQSSDMLLITMLLAEETTIIPLRRLTRRDKLWLCRPPNQHWQHPFKPRSLQRATCAQENTPRTTSQHVLGTPEHTREDTTDSTDHCRTPLQVFGGPPPKQVVATHELTLAQSVNAIGKFTSGFAGSCGIRILSIESHPLCGGWCNMC